MLDDAFVKRLYVDGRMVNEALDTAIFYDDSPVLLGVDDKQGALTAFVFPIIDAISRRNGTGRFIIRQQRQFSRGDQFGDLLKTEALAEAIAARRQPATLRMQPGYDHSYYFVSTFMEDHISFHAEALYGVDA